MNSNTSFVSLDHAMRKTAMKMTVHELGEVDYEVASASMLSQREPTVLDAGSELGQVSPYSLSPDRMHYRKNLRAFILSKDIQELANLNSNEKMLQPYSLAAD